MKNRYIDRISLLRIFPGFGFIIITLIIAYISVPMFSGYNLILCLFVLSLMLGFSSIVTLNLFPIIITRSFIFIPSLYMKRVKFKVLSFNEIKKVIYYKEKTEIVTNWNEKYIIYNNIVSDKSFVETIMNNIK